MPPEVTMSAGPAQRLLIFSLDAHEFALPVERVVHVFAHRGATPVPGALPFVEGIVPVRGTMLTLVDLRRRLDLPSRTTAAAAQVIVVESAGERLGLVVDAVRRIATGPGAAAPLDVDTLIGAPA